ncbi:GMP synthase [glutamine-hydrolyzing] [Brevinematales bacterium NS]|nr:GMP synthase [glutamine-hydrolyzing] [Brevinematales bacterium NS]
MKGSIVILDFGSQYTQLIARRIRELGVFSEIYPYTLSLEELKAMEPAGIVLSGGPSSVSDPHAPMISPEMYELGIPILGICYGMQLTAHLLGGRVERSLHREYGKAFLDLLKRESLLFQGVRDNSVIWMSHGDSVLGLPEGFEIVAKSQDGALTAIEHRTKPIYCVQFHPEVAHTEDGRILLSNFVKLIARASMNWTMENFVEKTIQDLQSKCRGKRVVLGVSGGVDSTTLAVLAHRALGTDVKAIFVNNGLLRYQEAEEVLYNLRERLGLTVEYIDATDRFLSALQGVTDPEQKRKIIGKVFVDVFYHGLHDFDFLIQGTLYPDVIESNAVKGPSQTIKTHHNRVKEVEELEKQGRIIEPFKFLFKDEVREVARILGIPEDILGRHPFPGPGLAVRILGEITSEKLDILRKADHIFISELKASGYYDRVWQAFAVFLPIRSVGVMGDERSYGHVIALRSVTSSDGMTAEWGRLPLDLLERVANRIVREIPGINRVVYDITSKPPATIEWE